MASWSRSFPGRAEQVAEARLFTASVLTGRPEAETAVLVVSELATNALRHTASGEPGGTFRLSITISPDGVTVMVSDHGPSGTPAIRRASGDELPVSGHGLVLVAMLAKEWGAIPTAHGWRVWADLLGADCDAE
jgi:serine/threonine-protein kinase RsbW